MTALTLAAVQMNALPAPTANRLVHAETFVEQAAARGAQIVVLTEVFNTGYEYTDANYALAEPADGSTPRWMKATAARLNIYLAGSFLLRAGDDIFNSLWLVAPDGKTWRYDKTYPWAWERAYFRGGSGPVVAETPLGKFGLLICWDTAHPNLWAQYAGKVDAMLISSCPPLIENMDYHLPDGKTINTRQLGPIMNLAYKNAEQTFGEFTRRQAAWLGVPVLNTTATHQFRSRLPRPKLSLAVMFTTRPDLWKYISRAGNVEITQGYHQDTYIADAQGHVLEQVPAGQEGFALAQVELAAQTPIPNTPQPPFGLHPLAYYADRFANKLLESYYQKHKKART